MAGIFYGVGVGPGDPELITLKAIQTIKNADVIIAPKTEKKEDSVALTIATPYLKADVSVVKLVFPMVSDDQTLTEAWRENKECILEYLQAGKNVVFLTLGDAMFYSTYIYVFQLLQDCGFPIVTIPGITAFAAIGSQLGYPLVEGNDTLTVIPATMDEAKLDRVLAVADNVVLMKVYKNFPRIREMLDRHGLAANAVMISRCGLDDEQVIRDLAHVAADYRPNYLSTILTRRSKG
ncbi:MAG: precorrin-2 C(20)-methyltransferase [Sporomusaceae bacterium]|nr:precorrin-2 C(20)-methyltransferase [Sporomusaceae bacterium]